MDDPTRIAITQDFDRHGRPIRCEFTWKGDRDAPLFIDSKFAFNTFGWSQYVQYGETHFKIGPYTLEILVDARDQAADPLNQWFELRLVREDRFFAWKEWCKTAVRRIVLVAEALGLAYVPPGQFPSLSHVFRVAKGKKVGMFREWTDEDGRDELYLLYINGHISEEEYFARLQGEE